MEMRQLPKLDYKNTEMEAKMKMGFEFKFIIVMCTEGTVASFVLHEMQTEQICCTYIQSSQIQLGRHKD